MKTYGANPTVQLLLVLTIGAIAAIACGVSTCVEAQRCNKAGTCEFSQNALCSFSSKVSVMYSAAYNTQVTNGSLLEMLRGVCSPGERLTTLSNTATCVPFYTFPSAINTEIEQTWRQTEHQKACGRWIDAGGSPLLRTTIEYQSMSDHDNWVASLQQVENATTYDPRLANTQMAKFRAVCRRTTAAGSDAILAAGRLAFATLRDYIDRQLVTNENVMKVEGKLTSHYCDTSVRTSTSLLSDSTFKLSVLDGWFFSNGVLPIALHLMGESTATQIAAERARAAISTRRLSQSYELFNNSDAKVFLEAATDESSVNLDRVHVGMLSLVHAVRAQHAETPDDVIAYEKGVAAFCVYSAMELASSAASSATLQAELRRMRKNRPTAVALNRLATDATELEVDAVTISDATSITVSQLVSPIEAIGEHNCIALMRAFYPDDVDKARFDATVEPQLYTRLKPLVSDTRVAAAAAVSTRPINNTLTDPALVASQIHSAGVRIAGAARGSWAGIARAIPRGSHSSSDDMFTILLNQARAIFKDEVVNQVLAGTVNACDHTPFFASTKLNAYMLPSVQCSVILLGIMRRPYASALYDDESLISRIVGVVGHELAHVSLNTPYKQTELQRLLRWYRTSTFNEAIADVIAAAAAVRTGYVTSARFAKHWSQLWCARVPFAYTPSSDSSHPAPNERGDFLAATLLDMGI